MMELMYVAARHEQFQAEARQNMLLAQLKASRGGSQSLRLRNWTVFDNLLRGLTARVSRRGVWGAAAGIVLGAASARLPFAAEARKKRRRNTNTNKKKLQLNAFGCVDVGKACRGNSANCCSGICDGTKPKKGKKDLSRCIPHDVAECQPEQDFCAGIESSCGEDGERGVCMRTTGNASFCARFELSACSGCQRDADCEAGFGSGAACIVCSSCAETGNTFCAAPAT